MMYRTVECDDPSILESKTQWPSIRALQTWAVDHGMTVERIRSERDDSISYLLSDDHGPVARIKKQR
jgi:hypothetical protein